MMTFDEMYVDLRCKSMMNDKRSEPKSDLDIVRDHITSLTQQLNEYRDLEKLMTSNPDTARIVSMARRLL